MDNSTIQVLSKVISDNWKEKKNIKKKLNSILERKSNKRIIFELNESIESRQIHDKNKAVLITVIALIRRNLDATQEIGILLQRYGLINQLFGGLIKLLDGRSETFKIDIGWGNKEEENNFEFLKTAPSFEYWTFIDLINTALILNEFDTAKFEHILLKDTTKLLLLNCVQGHIRWEPSDSLIMTLLNDQDSALKRSIGFSFLISRVERMNNQVVNGQRVSSSVLRNQINQCIEILEGLPSNYRAELLINYFLYNRRARFYHSFLAKLLINIDLQEGIIGEIQSKKIKSLDDIFILLFVIRKTRLIGAETSKFRTSLYDVITDRIQEFVKTGTGIYFWESRIEGKFKSISQMLPKRNQIKLQKFILKNRSQLMISELDRLVRYDIYLQDIKKAEIIDGMNKVLVSNL